MPEEMLALLSSYYGMTPEDAAEILSELKSTASLRQLATQPQGLCGPKAD
jgi:hypothetical protein